MVLDDILVFLKAGSESVLIECGSRHLQTDAEADDAHSATLSRYFQQHAAELGIEYHPFDPLYGDRYEDVQALATSKPCVIFSHHVLNEPELLFAMPFWKLPGRHFHAASFAEMCAVRELSEIEDGKFLQAVLARGIKPDDGDAGEKISALREEMDRIAFAKNPAAHLVAFKRRFELPSALDVRCALTDGLITYTWGMNN